MGRGGVATSPLGISLATKSGRDAFRDALNRFRVTYEFRPRSGLVVTAIFIYPATLRIAEARDACSLKSIVNRTPVDFRFAEHSNVDIRREKWSNARLLPETTDVKRE